MSESIINIYDDEQSEIILDNSSFDPTATIFFHNLGEQPSGQWGINNTSINKYQNASFIDLHIFDEDDNFIITLNSGKPLLLQPSTGKFYFGDFHSHKGTYMVGAKHRPFKHETLQTIRETQITPVPFDALQPDDPRTQQKYAIKLSEVFEILKNIPNFTLLKDSKFKIKYAIFGDLLLQTATNLALAQLNLDEEEEQTETIV